MVILKFGGSSVATAAAIARVAAIVERERRPKAVVVSALAGVTDALVDIARLAEIGDPGRALDRLEEIAARHAAVASEVRSADRRAALETALKTIWSEAAERIRAHATSGPDRRAGHDALIASGELASSRIVQALLLDRGFPTTWIDARTVVITDGRHGRATPIEASIRERAGSRLRPSVDRGEIPILGGFIGATPDGSTTTLGRGGSDYSASLIGAALGASEVQIWTDVDGMLTADPRTVANATLVRRLSFAEGFALAHFGAKVLHPSTVHPAVAAAIPVRILNSRAPDQPGTLITGQVVQRRHELAGLAARCGITVLHVRSRSASDRTLILAKLAAAGDDSGLAIHMATSTDTGVALAIDASEGVDEVVALAATIGEVERHDHLAIIAAVGDGLRQSPLLCAATLRALEGIPLHLVIHAPDSCHLAVVVSDSRVARAMSQLHARFFESERSHAAVDGWHPSARRRGQGAGATTHTSPTTASQETRA